MQLRWLVSVAAGIGLAACSPASSQEGTSMADAMHLSSPAFADGGSIPEEHTCDGGDVSPPLAWDGVPDGTDSFALVVTDPDSGGFVHWVLTDIPGDLRELPEGQGDAIGVPGRNNFGGSGWGGPCPPSGEHRYVFTLYAVSEPLGLDPGSSAERVRSAAEGVTLARGELTGVYARR